MKETLEILRKPVYKHPNTFMESAQETSKIAENVDISNETLMRPRRL